MVRGKQCSTIHGFARQWLRYTEGLFANHSKPLYLPVKHLPCQKNGCKNITTLQTSLLISCLQRLNALNHQLFLLQYDFFKSLFFFSSFCMIGYHSNSPVFHTTYCTHYCLKSPLEHNNVFFQSGLYFFQHCFFFFLSCLSKVAEGKGHIASRLIGQELDLLYVLVVFRPTNTSFLLPHT